MSNRFISGMSVPGMAVALISLVALPVMGQVTDTAPKSDLQGTYDLATMTPLERWPGDPPFLTKEQAEILQRAELERRVAVDPPDGPRPPPVGRDPSPPKSFFEALSRQPPRRYPSSLLPALTRSHRVLLPASTGPARISPVTPI